MTGPVMALRNAGWHGCRAGAAAVLIATCGGFAALAVAAPPAAVPAASARPARIPKPGPAAPDSATVMGLLRGVRNAACPLAGVATGGQIASDHVKGLAQEGFRTVLDLRDPGEARGFDESGAVTSAGLAYLTLPVTAGTLTDSTFDAVRALMGDARRHPILVHCASGNRVGVVLLPWLVLDRGWKLKDAIAAAVQGGMQESPMRSQALDYVQRHRAKR